MIYKIQIPHKREVNNRLYRKMLRKFRDNFTVRLHILIESTLISEDEDIRFAGSLIDYMNKKYIYLRYIVFSNAFFPRAEREFWDAINALSKVVINDPICEKYLYRLVDLFDKYIDKAKKLVSIYAPHLKVIVGKI